MAHRRMASVKTVADFRALVEELGLTLPLDDVAEAGVDAPLGQRFSLPTRAGSLTIGNRFAILPMEGWDGTSDGKPSGLTQRRWRNFGLSGAKLIWGGEAVAVSHDGRANPHQLWINDATVGDIGALRQSLVAAHVDRFGAGSADDLFLGLQLTHSGRFSRPNSKTRTEPRVAYRHPQLDTIVGIQDDSSVMADSEIARLVDQFIRAARLASDAGFQFVDIKHCHGYFAHELLSAYDRPGAYGGSLENRSRFLREVVAGVRAEAPGLEVGVRLSLFDFLPFRAGPGGVGEPSLTGPYGHAFGGDGTGLGIDLGEVSSLLGAIEAMGINLLCATAGSPYYNPHLVRPAAFPPTDGYLPPEHPLVGVARQIATTAQLKARHPRLAFVGSGYSFLQDWLPNVAQRVVRDGGVDFVGLGRMVLSYPDLPADVVGGQPLRRKQVCRTFSDCTTAPRNGMVSGCYPLDPAYKARAEFARVQQSKRDAAARLAAPPATTSESVAGHSNSGRTPPAPDQT